LPLKTKAFILLSTTISVNHMPISFNPRQW